MVISGEWLLGEDEIPRPIVRGEVLAGDGVWTRALFLLDTGADCTVFSQSLLAILKLPEVQPQERIAGLGGDLESVAVETVIRLTRDQGGKVTFHGQFAAVTDLETLDVSVLGRDIAGLFAAIIDRPGNVVCLLGQRHYYSILER
jgi:hypothetical protein